MDQSSKDRPVDNAGEPTPKKRETVWDGPVPEIFNRKPTLAAFTIPQAHTTGGTVFDEAKFVPKAQDTSVARKAVTKTIRVASVRFFIVAASAMVEFIVYRADLAVSIPAALNFVVFITIGIFALRMNRAAFLAAIVVYGASTLFMLGVATFGSASFISLLVPLVGRVVLLYKLYERYHLLHDLHQLEADQPA